MLVDGVCIWGESYVNESMIIGEVVLVVKGVGDVLIGGIMNFNGVLYICVMWVGCDIVFV